MRPTKDRHVEQLPPIAQFKPVGVPIFAVDEIVISVEEMEAIRLADMEGLDQGPAGREAVRQHRPEQTRGQGHGRRLLRPDRAGTGQGQ